jgi:hypothetical protein
MKYPEWELHTDREQQSGCQGLRGAWNGELVFMGTGFQSARWKILEMDGDSSTIIYKDSYTTILHTYKWFKIVNFILVYKHS